MTDLISPINYDALEQTDDEKRPMLKENYLSLIGEVEVEVEVVIGHTKLTVEEIQQLSPNQVLALNEQTDEPVKLTLQDKPIAEGELVQQGNYYGILIKQVLISS